MSGHSKWSKVKHQKAGTDAHKSAAFTKIARALTIAARAGGGAKLRFVLEQARAINMPKETIDRAIDRGARGDDALEALTYEGFGPGGAALIIEAATDNRSRTVSQVKYVLEKYGGSLAHPGSTRYLFETNMSLDATVAANVHALIRELKALDDVQNVRTNIC